MEASSGSTLQGLYAGLVKEYILLWVIANKAEIGKIIEKRFRFIKRSRIAVVRSNISSWRSSIMCYIAT